MIFEALRGAIARLPSELWLELAGTIAALKRVELLSVSNDGGQGGVCVRRLRPGL
jgi:hypothetical protein